MRFLYCPYRYLSPMRPGSRVLPPDSPAPPSSQVSSQPSTQNARLPKSNSLSLFYKKCKLTFQPKIFILIDQHHCQKNVQLFSLGQIEVTDLTKHVFEDNS